MGSTVTQCPKDNPTSTLLRFRVCFCCCLGSRGSQWKFIHNTSDKIMKPVVKASFKRTFQLLHPSALFAAPWKGWPDLSTSPNKYKKSRIILVCATLLSHFTDQKVRGNEEVRLLLSKWQLQNGVPVLLTPSPLTKTRQSKVVRTFVVRIWPHQVLRHPTTDL